MSNYKSDKQTPAVIKQRAGEIKINNIKSSSYLPGVLQTDLNAKWLDSTLDQMISKGDLETIDAYVGSKSSKYQNPGDFYLKESAHTESRQLTQLEPAIITRNADGDIVTAISVDDIANRVNQEFTNYSYTAAYATDSFVFRPPIDEDKFINYNMYYWTDDLPVYTTNNIGETAFFGDDDTRTFHFVDYRAVTQVSVDGVVLTSPLDYTIDSNNVVTTTVPPAAGSELVLSGSAISYTADFLTDVRQNAVWHFTDDNVDVDLQTGMLIKIGAGYDPAITGITYMVAGVGSSIRLIPYTEINSVTGQETVRWQDTTIYKPATQDYWDSTQARRISTLNGDPNIHDVVAGYNATMPTPMLKLRFGDTNKNEYVRNNMVVRMDETWTDLDALDAYRVFVLNVVAGGNVTVTTLIDAQMTPTGVEQFVPAGLSRIHQQLVGELQNNWDTITWDKRYLANTSKDYLVVDRADYISSAWSRVNKWIHKSTLVDVAKMVPTMLLRDYLESDRQAKRPIIEFGANMEFINAGNRSVPVRVNPETVWKGPVNYIISLPIKIQDLFVGSTYVIPDSNKIFRREDGVFSVNVAARSTLYTIVDPGDTDFTLIGAPDNLPGTTFRATGTGAGTGTVSGYARVVDQMVVNDTLLILDSPESDLATEFRSQDAYWNGTEIVRSQVKAIPNQPPLFALRDVDGVYLSDTSKYPETSFRGNYVFSYKMDDLTKQAMWERATYGAVTDYTADLLAGTSSDTELGFPLTYRDMGLRADIVFENSIMAEKYQYTVTTHRGDSIGRRRDVPGYYSYVRADESRMAYSPSYLPLGAKTQQQYTATTYVYPFVSDLLSGTANNLTYTSSILLSEYPAIKVYIDGVETTDFAISEYTVELGSQPPVGTNNIEIRVSYVELPVGSTDWSTQQEFITLRNGNPTGFTVSELYTAGVYRKSGSLNPNLIVAAGETYVFHDLIGTNDFDRLEFFTNDGLTLVDPSYIVREDTNNDGFAETVLFTVPDNVDSVFYYGYAAQFVNARLTVVDSLDFLYHSLIVNGIQQSTGNYVIESDAIYIPAKIAPVGSLIDLEYQSSDTQTSSLTTTVPDVHSKNATNQYITEFTISETLGHWTSIIESTSNFQGQSFGDNNSFKKISKSNAAGTIQLHTDISIMHDMCYGDTSLDLSTALNQQARDWWAFKLRFISQVRRLYAVNTYTSLKDLVNDAVDAIVVNRRGTDLYADSNMLYSYRDKTDTVILDVTDPAYDGCFFTKYSLNCDRTQTDHMYVYLTENQNLGGKFVERLLVKDRDYVVDGSEIQLLVTPNANGEALPYVTVYWHDMDSVSHVPPSIAKLSLSHTYVPGLDADELVCHDGDRYPYNPASDLDDITASNFDPVVAALYELEKRVYAGIGDLNRTVSVNKYIPSQHRSTWYNLQTIDNFIEKYFVQWHKLTGNESLTPDNYYQLTDSWTWNFSTIDLNEHLNTSRLPGHWKGAYNVVFGTHTPHLTPWIMLGINSKPTWWDDHYPSAEIAGSWAAGTKRTAFLEALKRGIINNPADTPKQDVGFAYYYWDWDNKCPVGTDGNLVPPYQVLGTPAMVDAAQPFVWGDWGPTEIKWRQSALGQAALMSAIVKLNPASAWTDFFQPDYIAESADTTNTVRVTRNNLEFLNPQDYYYPGNNYHQYIKRVDVIMSTDGWGADSTIEFLNGHSRIPASAVLNINDAGEITHVTMAGRGIEYQEMPVADVINSNIANGAVVDLEIVLGERSFVTNGICQAQRNAILRNNLGTDLEQQYYSLDTQLLQKVAGFTSKDLINFYTESGPTGAFRINENDQELIMYSGTPTEINVASLVNITRTVTGYRVSGISNALQLFMFNLPVVTGNNDFTYVTLSDTTNVKKYSRFSSEASILEFDTVLNKIQDTYNFIRGYRNYLENKGFVFSNNKDAEAAAFAQWAVNSEVNEVYTVKLGNSISYVPVHGHVLEFDSLPENVNSILGTDRNIIDTGLLAVSRSRDLVTIAHKEDFTELGSVGIAEADYEHAVVFANTTQFNQVIFDDVLNSRQWRLRMEGRRTADWDGNRRGPGYLIFDNKIVKNFDSSVQYVDDYYRTDVDKFNPGIAKAERITNGNIDRQWVNELNLPNRTVSDFYKGAIRASGTSDIIGRIGRSNLVNSGTSVITAHEEWMFRHSYFGDTSRTKSTEIEISQNLIKSSPQIINLDDPGIVFVNKQKDFNFDVKSFQEYTQGNYAVLRTAGPLLDTDTRYTARTVEDLENVFDPTADYAVTRTWDSVTSYKLGDYVRHQGHKYRCAVSAIGYTPVSSDLVFTGYKDSPVFEYASALAGDDPSAIIDGTPIWFNTVSREFDNIVATGTNAGATVASPTDITIDAVTVPLVYTPDTPIVDVTAAEQGNPFVISASNLPIRVLPDTTGKDLVINGVTVILYDVLKPADVTENYTGTDLAPAPVVENFVGVLSQTDFTIATTLTPTTYAVTLVTVDSVVQTDGVDYTVSGQTLSFTVAPTAGAAIAVTCTHDEVLQTIFPVSAALDDNTVANYVTSVSEVHVNSVLQTLGVDYTVNTFANQVEFINAPGAGLDVEFTIHVTHYQEIQDIVDAINDAAISGGYVTASIYDTYKIKIKYDVQSNASLTLDLGGTAITDLALTSGIYAPATVLAPVDGPMTASIVAGLINTSGLMPNNITATASITGELIITKEPTTATTVTTTLNISGSTRIAFGLPNVTAVSYSDVPTASTAAQAAAIINATGIPGISAIVADVYLQVTSINEQVDLGDETNNMNFAAGIPGGVHYRTNTIVENVFDPADWTEVEKDSACFNIWLTNDSGIQNATSTTDGIISKFNGWNVLQVQDFGYYTTDTDPGCSICAGTTTSDGNDARVTLNVPHTLSVGDYVMLVNTTTKPNIDGIHRVTRIGNTGEERVFYIDRFIEECGSAPNVFVLRNARFNSIDDMNATIASDYYNWDTNTRVFVHRNSLGFPSNNVFRFNGTIFEQILHRYKDARVVNTTIENILVYDNDLKQTVIELELFDPVRGIIPGVADREIDSKGPIDQAVYTDSTDLTFTGNERGAWGENQVGKTWWNTSNVRYYDYDQSDVEYRTAHWGKLFPGSTIDIYEWTKSLVPPEDWAAAVKAESNQFGVPATGTAYSVFDPTTNEDIYYYTELEEWNSSLAKYDTVYYFWVKNKTTVPNPRRNLTVKQIASIIENPTANGIVWCAVVSSSAESNQYNTYDNVIIVSNVGYYLNSGTNVLQINKKLQNQAHSSWTIISEGNDFVSDYWYAGLRDNLVGFQTGTTVRFPNINLHEYNRYGDDRAIGQGWFTDTKTARREAVTIANRMLKNMNIVQELGQKWFRCVGPDNHVTDIEQNVNNVPDWIPGETYEVGDQVIWNKKVYQATVAHVSAFSARTEFIDPSSGWEIVASIYDLSLMWEYADYVEPIRDPAQVPSKYLLSLADLATVDKSQHNLVMVKFYNDQLRHDESEIYQLVNDEWLLVEKKNATIQFNNLVWDPTTDIKWDTLEWDVGAWDADTSVYMWYLIRALREDLFIQKFLDNFNTLFFGVVKYAISQHKQVDWVFKTTYLQVEITTPFDSRIRKYTKSGVEGVEGFINTVKPFHTKIRSVFDTYTQNEQVIAHISDTLNSTTTILMNQFDVPSITGTMNMPVYGGDIVSGGSFTDVLEDGYAGAEFTDSVVPDTEINGDVFLNVSQYNHVTFTDGSTTGDAQRRTLFNADFVEHLSIAVQTAYDAAIPNPVDTTGRTHVYLQDNLLGVSAFSLTVDKQGTLSTELDNTATTVELTTGDGAKFSATGGYAWIGGEIVRYGQALGDQLLFVDRAFHGSLSKTHPIGAVIVDVSGTQLSTIDTIAQQINSDGKYVTGVRFNTPGKSLLDTTSDTVEANQLQSSATGIDL